MEGVSYRCGRGNHRMETIDRSAPGVRLFSVAEYHRMADAGVFAEQERTELLSGVVFSMPPAGPPHSSTVNAIVKYLIAVLDAAEGDVRFEEALTIDGGNEPVPDIVVARPSSNSYRDRHPTPEDVRLVIEVADTSLNRDLGEKRILYGSVGIPEYWVVDLAQRKLHRFDALIQGRYTRKALCDGQDTLTLSGATIAVERLLPPAN